jgi:uncharacterized protein YggU (UPF0235/DUF167 family)
MSGANPVTLGQGEASLRVRVTPRSGRNSIGGLYRDPDGRAALIVRVSAAPEKGKANKAVIATLARCLKLARSRLTITGGLAERTKTVAIAGDPADFEAALRGLVESDGEG